MSILRQILLATVSVLACSLIASMTTPIIAWVFFQRDFLAFCNAFRIPAALGGGLFGLLVFRRVSADITRDRVGRFHPE